MTHTINAQIPQAKWLRYVSGGSKLFEIKMEYVVEIKDLSRTNLSQYLRPHYVNQIVALNTMLKILGRSLTSVLTCPNEVDNHSRQFFAYEEGENDRMRVVMHTIQKGVSRLYHERQETHARAGGVHTHVLNLFRENDRTGHSANALVQYLQILEPNQEKLAKFVQNLDEDFKESVFESYGLDLDPEVVLGEVGYLNPEANHSTAWLESYKTKKEMPDEYKCNESSFSKMKEDFAKFGYAGDPQFIADTISKYRITKSNNYVKFVERSTPLENPGGPDPIAVRVAKLKAIYERCPTKAVQVELEREEIRMKWAYQTPPRWVCEKYWGDRVAVNQHYTADGKNGPELLGRFPTVKDMCEETRLKFIVD